MVTELIALKDAQQGVAPSADGSHFKVIGYLDPTTGNRYEDPEGLRLTSRMREVDHVCGDNGLALRNPRTGHLYSVRELANEAADHYHRDMVRLTGQRAKYNLRNADGTLITMDLGVNDVHTPATMPNYAAGYKIAEGVADMASPALLTPFQSQVYYTWNSTSDFNRKIPNIVASGADVPEVNPGLSPATFATIQYALGGLLPTEVQSNADAPLQPFVKLMQIIVDGLKLERDYRVATLLQASGSWNANLVTTLGAGAQWNGGASSDPILNIHHAMEQSFMPVTGIVMSELVWHDFLRNPAVQKFFGFKDSVSGLPDEQEIQRTLKGLPPITVAKIKYVTAGALTYVWGNHVVFLRQPAEMPPKSQMDVASQYTFRWNGGTAPDGSAQAGGFLVRSYFDPKAGARGGTRVVCTINDTEVQTSGLVGGLLLNAHQ